MSRLQRTVFLTQKKSLPPFLNDAKFAYIWLTYVMFIAHCVSG